MCRLFEIPLTLLGNFWWFSGLITLPISLGLTFVKISALYFYVLPPCLLSFSSLTTSFGRVDGIYPTSCNSYFTAADTIYLPWSLVGVNLFATFTLNLLHFLYRLFSALLIDGSCFFSMCNCFYPDIFGSCSKRCSWISLFILTITTSDCEKSFIYQFIFAFYKTWFKIFWYRCKSWFVP